MATQPPPEPPPASTPPPPGYRRGLGRPDWYGPRRGSLYLALALIVLGGYFLVRNLGLLSWVRDDVFWPLVLIALGLVLLLRRGSWWR